MTDVQINIVKPTVYFEVAITETEGSVCVGQNFILNEDQARSLFLELKEYFEPTKTYTHQGITINTNEPVNLPGFAAGISDKLSRQIRYA